MTKRKPQHSDIAAAKTPRNTREQPSATEIASSGDNRRLGDVDGNTNAGDARSPGADNPEDAGGAAADKDAANDAASR